MSALLDSYSLLEGFLSDSIGDVEQASLLTLLEKDGEFRDLFRENVLMDFFIKMGAKSKTGSFRDQRKGRSIRLSSEE